MNELLTAPLRELAVYDELRGRIDRQEGILSLTGCIDAQKAHLIGGLFPDAHLTLVVSENELSARRLREDLSLYAPEVLYYPAKDLLFYQADVASNQLDRQRMAVFRSILEGKKTVVVLPAPALMEYVTDRAAMAAEAVEFRWGEESDYGAVRENLVHLGYERCAEVMLPGQFAVRGDILDVWPLTEEHPVRIEFFGDEVDSMRTFDAESQRSIEELKSIVIRPAGDRTGRTAPFLNWFPEKETVIYLDEPGRIADALAVTEEEYTESVRRRAEFGDGDDELPEILGRRAVQAALSSRRTIALSMLDVKREGWKIRDAWGLSVQSATSYNNSFEMLSADLEKYRKRGFRVVVLSASHTRARRLAEGLQDYGIPAFYTEDRSVPLKEGQTAVLYGRVSRGFEYPMLRFALISESDIFGEQQKKRGRKKKKDGTRITSFSELSVGDYVVHENHGLGIYRGIEQMEVDHVLKDYIKLEYSGSNLYILATQLDLLQKYAGGGPDSAAKPRLSRIGGQEWNKTRSRVKAAVKDMAEELVRLYAVRETRSGYVCGPDTEWQKEFEEMFPFEETEDQIQAIEDTKRDMESSKIMDRLICGDVGYGKTEVALRAAFKAVQEGRQVAYLVPTTILAQQHYNTFSQRMRDFPVRVDLLCRFRTPAQITKTLRDLEKGQVDIVIGTHRLLSKDVKYKNLGLLVIDEEQRFGVSHKEKIKQLRKDVDVLTLTATPIPRTLHMSLIGIRDMSVLEEPPEDRVPIQTYVMEFNPEMVREAVCRELARGGQVYYVYNRVKDISEMARRIQDMVPEARVSFADGQMNEAMLESIMVDFINGEIDVLVTTTIIETGLDISNVNTIIIHDADRFGLSQLYQLRGRVGRSNRTAYAFLMYRKDKILKEVAEKRLMAIREFTELGSGIKIAMRDLEIRGAGNLLGAEQSGHMESVGYDLYCRMLQEAVSEAKGMPVEEHFETVVDLSMDAFIPGEYIPNEFQKLDCYKRIAGIESDADMDDLADELMDRFGEIPPPVINLMRIANLKADAHRASITEVKQTGRLVRLLVLPQPRFDVTRLPEVIGAQMGRITVHRSQDGTYFLYHGDTGEAAMLRNLTEFFRALQGITPGKKE